MHVYESLILQPDCVLSRYQLSSNVSILAAQKNANGSFSLFFYPTKSCHILLLTLFQMHGFFSINSYYMNICR